MTSGCLLVTLDRWELPCSCCLLVRLLAHQSAPSRLWELR